MRHRVKQNPLPNRTDLMQKTTPLELGTSELKEGVASIASILNKHGAGELYFGVKDNGDVCGMQVAATTLRQISQAIGSSIEPRIYPSAEKLNDGQNHDYVRVAFEGDDAPYACRGTFRIRSQYNGLITRYNWTGGMREMFLGSGLFSWKPMSFSASRGDVYLDESSHTAMCVRNDGTADLLAEFSISETGGVDGAPGDQTGRESRVHGYYSGHWDGILHYNGKADGSGSLSDPSSDNVDDLARRVIAGEFGNGDERKEALGNKYSDVQRRVNEILRTGLPSDSSGPSVDIDALARAVINGDYGNGEERRRRLGSRYASVQRRVNELLA